MTFELRAWSGELTMRNVTSAKLTRETSSVLEANPIQGRQRPRRRADQMPTAAIPPKKVTAKPVTNIGLPGSRMTL